jgi:hypothetical protein
VAKVTLVLFSKENDLVQEQPSFVPFLSTGPSKEAMAIFFAGRSEQIAVEPGDGKTLFEK